MLRSALRLLAATLAFTGSNSDSAAEVRSTRRMEHLDRGVVAIRQGVIDGSGTVYVGWRLLADDPNDVAFDVYRTRPGREAVKLNQQPITKTTDFVDVAAGAVDPGTRYDVVPAAGAGQGRAPSFEVSAEPRPYLPVQLDPPPRHRANDCSVADLDGDGQYELIVKWEPRNARDNARGGKTDRVYLDALALDGTRLWRVDLGPNIRAGAHYTQFMVYDLDGDGKAEVVCKTADGTVDGAGKVIGDASKEWANEEGRILAGPEFLTCFSGETGAAISTVDYVPARHPGKEDPSGPELKAIWGDGHGNRSDRFLAAVAYLDGRKPSVVMCRGYYTRSVLAAWDLVDGELKQRWVFDSMGMDRGWSGQGNHNLSVSDVDGDGRDEILYGSMCVDDDGSGLYTTRLGHGDSAHLGDLDPARPGLENWTCLESRPYGAALWDAKTGEVIFRWEGPRDTGRACAADIDPRHAGYELWASAGCPLFNVRGEVISARHRLPVNFVVNWDGDDLQELLDGTRILKYDWETGELNTLLDGAEYDCASNNGSKATPCLSADLLGDYREEVVWRTRDSSELRIFTTTVPAQRRRVTLMQDPHYRLSVAWQNVAYNQPPHTSFYLGHASASGAPPEAPTHLRVNDTVNPVGTGATPCFGWYVNDADDHEIQTAYQILVASSETELAAEHGDLWDSGKVVGRIQNHVAYAGDVLASDQRCNWKVRTWDKDDHAGPYSDPATFVIGLNLNRNWAGAQWIKRDTSDADDYTFFRKQVTLPDKPVERATVYVSSVHKYALYLNDTLVGKGPSYHYPQYQYYNAYDITAAIRPNATNQFAVFNHWFGGGQGRPTSRRGVIMKAIVRYADGSKTEFGTDGAWKQSRAAAWSLADLKQRNSGEGVGYVERIDARRLTPDWYTLNFDDSSWGTATVIGAHPVSPWTGTLAPDLSRIEERVIAPSAITDLGSGKYVVDLGRVYAGMPRIRFSGGTPGATVNMRGGYALWPSGEIDTSKNQRTDMSYHAILDGGSFVYEPVEYLGLRYFQVDNAPMPVTTNSFSFIVRHSRMDTTASAFDSPNATLNRVWAFMKHSLLTCAQEEFVDTPTREKGGFLGDAAIQSMAAMPVMHERVLTWRMLHEFLQSMDQHWSDPGEAGRMNAVYPNRDGARDIPDYTQAYLVWVWDYYMETGDLAFLARHYGRFKDIADYVHDHVDSETGLVSNLTGGSGAYQYGIVDWPAAMRFGYDMTYARTVINGWAYADFDVMARVAEAVGNPADQADYRARADALKSAINARLLNRSGMYVDGLDASGMQSSHVSQHANMFPLALGIVPETHASNVVDKVKELEMRVGMVTLPWLIRAIGEAGEGEHLVKLLTHERWPGWARCLSRGATAAWESWDADTAGQSMSHAWGAAGLEAYVRYILGIKPTKPQYEHVRIKPLDFGAALHEAGGTIPTDRGEISVHWASQADALYRIKVDLPVNVTADIAVPRGPTAHPKVYLDGAEVTGTEDGEHIRIEGVGSGTHTLIRSDAARPSPGSSRTG